VGLAEYLSFKTKERFFKPVPLLIAEHDIDHLVAEGAAIIAESIRLGRETIKSEVEDKDSELLRSMELHEANPCSLGLLTEGDIMSIILPRNISYPCKKTESYSTVFDNQTGVKVEVFQGEEPKASSNKKLDTLVVTGLPSLPMGDAQVEVTFQLDESGILRVHVLDKSNITNTVSKEVKIDFSARRTTETVTQLGEDLSREVQAYDPAIQAQLNKLSSSVYALIYKLSADESITRQDRMQIRNDDIAPYETFIHQFHGAALQEDDVILRQKSFEKVIDKAGKLLYDTKRKSMGTLAPSSLRQQQVVQPPKEEKQ